MNASTLSANCSAPSPEYQYHLFPIVYCLVLLLGIPGNLGALYIFIFKLAPRTPSDILIINLAVADSLFLCTLPFRVHYHLNKNAWIFGNLMCRITGTFLHGNIYISIVFMTCICVDRYIATVHPHTYLKLRNTKWTTLVSLAVWSVSGTAILVFILMGPLESDFNSCFENLVQHEWDNRIKLFSFLALIFGSLLPSLVILVCYPLVARRISLIRTQTARKALKVIVAILVITVLCFLPHHIVHLLYLLRRLKVITHCYCGNAIHQARRVTMALVSINACLDPLLYFVASNHCKWRPTKLNWHWGRVKGNRGVYTIARS
ncbi:lysophosphatidic acid receptor 6 [Aplochiton taeniatus]